MFPQLRLFEHIRFRYLVPVMRWICVIAVLLAALATAPAGGVDEQFVDIYILIQDADGLARSKPREAIDKYTQANLMLQRLHKGSPDWNPVVVNFRLNYLAERLSTLGAPGAANSSVTSPSLRPVPETVPGVTEVRAASPSQQAASPSPALEAEVESLRLKVRGLESEKTLLEAKLREALAAIPAAVDPAELTRATTRIKDLQKENELMKARFEEEKKKKQSPVQPGATVEQLRNVLEEANRKLALETERARSIAETNFLLQAQYESAARLPVESAELAGLRRALESANQELARQRQEAARAALEQRDTRAKLEQLQAAADKAAALAAENELLKKQLAEARPEPKQGVPIDASRQLAEARAQIASLQSDRELLRMDRIRLEQQLGGKAGNAVEFAAQTARIKQLTGEKDDLEKRLHEAEKELSSRKTRVSASRVAQMEKDLDAYRSRVAVLEARAVPFTAGELALFSKPVPSLSGGTTKRPAVKPTPAARKKMEEAQHQVASGNIGGAEATLQLVVREPGTNVAALTALAATQIAQSHLEDAEKTLQQALAAAPSDPASLSLSGCLKYRQGRVDEAVEVLSRAAVADPKNAEVQNYLGLSLSQKGLRAPAESALRKAIQLQADYGSAHHNLAVIYLSQEPPMVELARWHYQKGIAAGQPARPEFEKLLQERAVRK